MALNIGGGSKPPSKGVDYSQHVGGSTHTAKPVTGMVTQQKTVSGQEIPGGVSQSETLHSGVFTDGMSITVEGGRVINLGNYETARVGVSITVPCTKDTLDESYEFATEWVSQKITEAVNSAQG